MVFDRIEHVTAGADDFDQHLGSATLGAPKITDGRGYTCEECQPVLAAARRSAARSCSDLRSKDHSSVNEDSGTNGCAAQPTSASACSGRSGRLRCQARRRGAKRETAGSRVGSRTPRRRLGLSVANRCKLLQTVSGYRAPLLACSLRQAK